MRTARVWQKNIVGACLLLLTAFAAPSMAQWQWPILFLEAEGERYDLGGQLRYLRDPSGVLTLEEVTGPALDERWIESDDGDINFGFDKAAYWFAVDLQQDGFGEFNWLLELPNATLDHVALYVQTSVAGGAYWTAESFVTGDMLAFDQRPLEHPSFIFPITTRAETPVRLLLRVESEASLALRPSLWSVDAFNRHNQRTHLLQGLYFGLMAVMVLYNFFISWTIRDRSYLHYFGMVLFIALTHATLLGYGYQYLWPDSPVWQQYGHLVFLSLGVVLMARFTSAFLRLGHTAPKARRGFDVLSLLALVLLLLSFAMPIHMVAPVYSLLVMATALGALISGVVLWYRGWLPARFFTIAWAAFAVGASLVTIHRAGLLHGNFWTVYGSEIGSAMMVTLLSFALADRIGKERRQRQQAQQEAIDNLAKYQSLYENALEGIFQMRPDGCFISANPAMIQLMGASSEQGLLAAQDDPIQSFIVKEDRRQMLNLLRRDGAFTAYQARVSNGGGKDRWLSVSARLLRSEAEGELIEGTAIDITEQKRSQDELTYLARHDPLTDLINRREFEGLLQRAIDDAREGIFDSCLLYMDLDQFKVVNDTCGHAAGDVLLRQIAGMWGREIRGTDTLARLGGDEFGVLLAGCTKERGLEIATRMQQVVGEYRFVWEGRSFAVGVSIGLVMVGRAADSVSQMLIRADTACYAAKDRGRNRLQVYDDGVAELQIRRDEMKWIARLNEALEGDLFKLVAQPIKALNPARDQGVHYELLLRMDEGGGQILPGAFLPAAARYGLMPKVDRWVVRTYFRWLAEHPDHMAALSHCGINLSAASFSDDDFRQFLLDAFSGYRIPPEKICFEVTETMAVVNLERTEHFMQSFRELGCKFALDDFGSGFSSYSYLKNLPLDHLKIDGTFVRDLLDDPIDEAMIKSINEVSHALGLFTVAEFVETEAVEAKLAELGVDFVQGYAIAAPMPLDRLPHVDKPRATISG